VGSEMCIRDSREFQSEVSALLKGVELGTTPTEVKAKIDHALTIVRGNDPTRSYKYKQALAALKADSMVEGGTPSPKDKPMSDADKTREAIFSRRKRDPAEDLFAKL
jgi:hypothetical protein